MAQLHRSVVTLRISGDELMALGERGIELGLDIYSPTDEELEEQRRSIGLSD